jgi:hypothetical protein
VWADRDDQVCATAGTPRKLPTADCSHGLLLLLLLLLLRKFWPHRFRCKF